MENLDPGDGAWWWVIALQGWLGALVGGLVAGGVAWWAVRRTIRHERELTAAAEHRSDLLEVRRVVADLQAFCFGFMGFAAVDSDRQVEMAAQLYTKTAAASALAYRPAPELAEELRDFGSVLTERAWDHARPGVLQVNAVNVLARRLNTRLSAWIRDPDLFAELGRCDWATKIEEDLAADQPDNKVVDDASD